MLHSKFRLSTGSPWFGAVGREGGGPLTPKSWTPEAGGHPAAHPEARRPLFKPQTPTSTFSSLPNSVTRQ